MHTGNFDFRDFSLSPTVVVPCVCRCDQDASQNDLKFRSFRLAKFPYMQSLCSILLEIVYRFKRLYSGTNDSFRKRFYINSFKLVSLTGASDWPQASVLWGVFLRSFLGSFLSLDSSNRVRPWLVPTPWLYNCLN